MSYGPMVITSEHTKVPVGLLKAGTAVDLDGKFYIVASGTTPNPDLVYLLAVPSATVCLVGKSIEATPVPLNIDCRILP